MLVPARQRPWVIPLGGLDLEVLIEPRSSRAVPPPPAIPPEPLRPTASTAVLSTHPFLRELQVVKRRVLEVDFSTHLLGRFLDHSSCL